MVTLPTPHAVIFDWDNTLVDTWPVIHSALQSTFRDFGLPEWDLQTTRNRVSKSMRDSFPDLFGDQWQKAGEHYQRHYRAHHLDRLTALPGAQEVLEALEQHALPMLVVSNKKGQSLREEVAHLGWDNYFKGIVGADDAARDKPHPDPVHLALSYLNTESRPEIWFVGDSEIDLATAAACGCTPILYGPHAAAHAAYTPTHYHDFPYSAHPLDHTALRELFRGQGI